MNKKLNIAIHGFGRIGRILFRLLINDHHFNLVSVNDLYHENHLRYLLLFDTKNINNDQINQEKINKVIFFNNFFHKNYAWKDLDIDILIDSSYGNIEVIQKNITKKTRILITKTHCDFKNIVFGVNHHLLDKKDVIISASSCTTNATCLTLHYLEKIMKIKKCFLKTIHAVTSEQKVVDSYFASDYRKGRSVFNNIIPTKTQASKGVVKVLPFLQNNFFAWCYRVPVLRGSILDLMIEVDVKISLEEIKNYFSHLKLQEISITKNKLVSTDIINCKNGALIDFNSIFLTDNFLHLNVWYDNEVSYCYQILRLLKYWRKIIFNDEKNCTKKN